VGTVKSGSVAKAAVAAVVALDELAAVFTLLVAFALLAALLEGADDFAELTDDLLELAFDDVVDFALLEDLLDDFELEPKVKVTPFVVLGAEDVCEEVVAASL